MLFEDQTIDALQTLPNAQSHFAYYLTGPDCSDIRAYISNISEHVPEARIHTWKESLHSLNNAKSVQAFSEIVALMNLQKLGWRLLPRKHALGFWIGNSQEEALLLSLSLIQQPTPTEAQNNRLLLERVLNRIDSERKIAIILRRPLPLGFDPAPIRLSISHWLDKTPSPGSFAYYKDQNIWLEVGVLEVAQQEGDNVVAFIQGPLRGDTVWEHIQHQAETLIQHYHDPKNSPIILHVGSIHPLPLLENSLRFALYGPTQRLNFTDTNQASRQFKFDPTLKMGWFQKEIAESVVGIMINQIQDHHLIGHSYQNPWSRHSFGNYPLPSPLFEVSDMEDTHPILGWNTNHQ